MPHRSIHALLQPFLPGEAHGSGKVHGVVPADSASAANDRRDAEHAELRGVFLKLFRRDTPLALCRCDKFLPFAARYRTFYGLLEPKVAVEAHRTCGNAFQLSPEGNPALASFHD
jgi:hypothetical protein